MRHSRRPEKRKGNSQMTRLLQHFLCILIVKNIRRFSDYLICANTMNVGSNQSKLINGWAMKVDCLRFAAFFVQL